MRSIIVLAGVMLICSPALADPSLPPVSQLVLTGPAGPTTSATDFSITDANYTGLPGGYVRVDWVDIGTGTEGHNLQGWGNALSPTSGYGGATDTLRVIWGGGDDGATTATVDMDFGQNAGDKYIAFRWLDGQAAGKPLVATDTAGDSFEFTVGASGGTVINSVDTPETWYELYAWNVGPLTGVNTVTITALDDKWSGWNTYGQVAFSEIATYAVPAPGAVLLVVLGLGVVGALRRRLS